MIVQSALYWYDILQSLCDEASIDDIQRFLNLVKETGALIGDEKAYQNPENETQFSKGGVYLGAFLSSNNRKTIEGATCFAMLPYVPLLDKPIFIRFKVKGNDLVKRVLEEYDPKEVVTPDEESLKEFNEKFPQFVRRGVQSESEIQASIGLGIYSVPALRGF